MNPKELEPKFKVGDILIHHDGVQTAEIIAVGNTKYFYRHVYNGQVTEASGKIFDVEEAYRIKPKESLRHEFETEVVSNNEFGKLYINMIPSSFVGKKVRITVEEVR